MKWYWAILLTAVMLVLTLALAELHRSQRQTIIHALTAISAVWVAAKSSSFGWGFFVLCLWPIGFPWFLIAKYRPQPEVTDHSGSQPAEVTNLTGTDKPD